MYTVINISYIVASNIFNSFVSFQYKGNTENASFVIEFSGTMDVSVLMASDAYAAAAAAAIQARKNLIDNPIIL